MNGTSASLRFPNATNIYFPVDDEIKIIQLKSLHWNEQIERHKMNERGWFKRDEDERKQGRRKKMKQFEERKTVEIASPTRTKPNVHEHRHCPSFAITFCIKREKVKKLQNVFHRYRYALSTRPFTALRLPLSLSLWLDLIWILFILCFVFTF